jgi:hypothetical protein
VVASSRETHFRDLFLWAALVGDDDFAFEFWKRTENPIRVALWGAHVTRQMTTRMQYGMADCLARSKRYQKWAAGLLNTVPTQAVAHSILSLAVKAWGPNTLVDLAMQLEMKEFIAQKHCQSLNEVWWRGGYSGSRIVLAEKASMAKIWLYGLWPVRRDRLQPAKALTTPRALRPPVTQSGPPFHQFVNPYLIVDTTGSNQGNNVFKEVGTIFRAILYTNRVAKAEIVRAGGGEHELKGRLETIKDAAGARLAEEESRKGGAAAVRQGAADSNAHSPLLAFYSIPMVKLTTRGTMHMLMLANYTQLLFTMATIHEVRVMGVPEISWSEIFFYFQAFANFADQAYQVVLLERRKVKVLTPFGNLLALGDRLLVIAFAVRLLSVAASHTEDVIRVPVAFSQVTFQIAHLMLSVDVIIFSIRTINFRSVSMKFGVLVIMVPTASRTAGFTTAERCATADTHV